MVLSLSTRLGSTEPLLLSIKDEKLVNNTRQTRRRFKYLAVLALGLVGISVLPADRLHDYYLARRIRTEADPGRRIVLVNETLARSNAFWTRQYVSLYENAIDETERVYLESILLQRGALQGGEAGSDLDTRFR